MSLETTFTAFKRHLVPDERIMLCDVSIQGGALSGVADKRLEPKLYSFAAEHGIGSKIVFIAATPQYILSERVFLRARPHPEAETVNETSYGARVDVFDKEDDWQRVALGRDDYLGWVPMTALAHKLPEPTHRFVALRGHLFAAPEVSSARRASLAFGTRLRVTGQEGAWSRVAYGKGAEAFVKSQSLWALGEPLPPLSPGAVASFARRFLETPYVWGGVSAWGLDCSGLVQTVFGAFGVALPRDADQQSRCGTPVEGEPKVADLLFFPGHVAISLGGTRFIHANAQHMRVTVDDFEGGAYGAQLRAALSQVRRLL